MEARPTPKLNWKVFLAVLALTFAAQITFDLNSNSDEVSEFALRLFISFLAALGIAFLWSEVRKRGAKEEK